MKITDHFKNEKLHPDFLPSALEITETPDSPLGRTVLYMIVAFIAAVLAWAYLGKVDIVAVAPGKVITEGKLKVVQPVSGGMIAALTVKEGDTVKKDQLLAELDTTTAKLDLATVQKLLDTAKLERQILIEVAAGRDPSSIINNANVSEETKTDLRQLADARADYTSSRRGSINDSINSAGSRLAAERQVAATIEANLAATKAKLDTLTQSEQTATDLQKITIQAERNDASKSIVELESALQSQKVRINEAQLNTSSAGTSMSVFNAENNSTAYTSAIEQDKKITELEDTLKKTQKALDQHYIKAPADGKILAISTTTIGGVVPAGQPFITIVPSTEPLSIEAMLDNKDVGLVHVGQKVAIKVDTYSFQRYGFIEGEVDSISPDAFNDDKQPIAKYKIIVTPKSLDTSKNASIVLSPGMTVTAEITTGQRRIIDFFLDPFLTDIDTSLKTR